MPPSLRRRAQPTQPPPPTEPFSDSDDEFAGEGAGEEEALGEDVGVEPDDVEEEEEEEPLGSPFPSPLPPSTLPPPPHLREISTLASWTVSSSKPGCSIPQLRHPSTSLFWQSDGPQPHHLNIHFFKLVRIVGLRLYLDFEADESYTPTRIAFLAGSGMNDLVEWGEMRLEQPKGWVWADFEGVAEVESGSSDEEDEDEEDDGDGDGEEGLAGGAARPGLAAYDPDASDFENAAPGVHDTPVPRGADTDPMLLDPQHQHQHQQQQHTPIPHHNQQTTPVPPTLTRPMPRLPFTALSPNASPMHQTPRVRPKKPKMPVLRCHVVQIKILENHQNGKDTHLRGLQIFARDNEKERGGGRSMGARKSLGARSSTVEVDRTTTGRRGTGAGIGLKGLAESDWMAEPMLR